MYSCSFFFFKQQTAYEMRISDWSSDVCSSYLFTSGFSSAYSFAVISLTLFLAIEFIGISSLYKLLYVRFLDASTLGLFFILRIALSNMNVLRADLEIGRASSRERVCQSV